MKKAFVTGGTGFIGSHLVEHLIELGVDVTALIRHRKKWLEGQPVTFVEGDVRAVETLRDSLAEVDTFIHCAAMLSGSSQEELDRVNVQSTVELVQEAIHQGVETIVVLSSLAALGPSTGGVAVHDDATARPVSMYGESKKRMEEALSHLDLGSSRLIVIRPPAVYGPREEHIFQFFKAGSLRVSPLLGQSKEGMFSIVHVRDLVSGIAQAAKMAKKDVGAGESDFFLLSGPAPVKWGELIDATQRAIGHSTVVVPIAPFVLRSLGTILETVGGALGQSPMLNREKANELSLEWVCSHDKATSTFNYQPAMDLQDGVMDTVTWYRKHKWMS
ncbi:MAG: SDR family NAD(P)-dependent oxidoreductase [Balneolaceae bacterium]|nr:SDR family NAD(P)-dependent oxidoreductase [Balneolaceae bacterium]